ncbi:unnamed protein product [Ranitomeya imitator]|uniref:SH3 domain-containing protein n=1 Tax=Ranitomeya imitator TaxID=111125 RepID=A0ABN9KWH7_9NEOB|nr:unnamed protein product [Ranitomeya imitator]
MRFFGASVGRRGRSKLHFIFSSIFGKKGRMRRKTQRFSVRFVCVFVALCVLRRRSPAQRKCERSLTQFIFHTSLAPSHPDQYIMVQTQQRPKLTRFGSLASLSRGKNLRSRIWWQCVVRLSSIGRADTSSDSTGHRPDRCLWGIVSIGTKLLGWRDRVSKMAGDHVKSAHSLLDLDFKSLAAHELNMKQMELDSATAKLDELRWELEKGKSSIIPSKVEVTEVSSYQNANPTLSPSLTRRSVSSQSPTSVSLTSPLHSNRLRQESSLTSPMPPSLTMNSTSTVPSMSFSSSPNLTRRSLPSDSGDPFMTVPSRPSWGRPSSPRLQYYDRPTSSTTSRLSSGSYDYGYVPKSVSPIPDGPPMGMYTEWAPPQRPPPAYEIPLGFSQPRFSDDVSSLRRRPPHQRSWNESDLDTVYDKKTMQDRPDRVSLGGVPVVKAWRETSLDPTPVKSKVGEETGQDNNDPGDVSVSSTLPRGYKFSSTDRISQGPDPGWKSGAGTLPRSLPSQQPISRIPVPPPGGRGNEEKPEGTTYKPTVIPEDPVCIILESSESRVGATAPEVEFSVPVVVSGGQTLEIRSALKGRNPPRMARPRRARLDPLILLLDGALTGELDVVTQALREVKDPSQPNEEGITALHNAICGANFHIVNLLLNHGANVNAADSHGWTPLHCAASCNDLQICYILVRHGAAIFATTQSDEVEQCMGETQSGVVYALWDYTAEFADELSVREGDTVTVLRKDGEGGTWWWAALCGREGYVPRNYFGMYPRLRPQRSPL